MNRATCLGLAFFVSTSSFAQDCISAWTPAFGPSPGLSPTFRVRALERFDFGNGPELVMGGDLGLQVSGVSYDRVARWDGANWFPIGQGLPAVFGLGVWDDGNGSKLYAAHTFGGLSRLDGDSWTDLTVSAFGTACCLLSHDDGSVDKLYMGGAGFDIPTAGANAAIACWDGTGWAPVGSGFQYPGTPAVNALVEFDDGSGVALYAAGRFLTAGSTTVNNIARWDGTSWTALGTGLDGTGWALIVFDDGSGPALWVSGTMQTAGGVPVDMIARWDGQTWSDAGAGLPNNGPPFSPMLSFGVVDDGNGPLLVAGGLGDQGLLFWDGAQWNQFPDGPLIGTTYDILPFGAGEGPGFFLGGDFPTVAGLDVNGIAARSPGQWAQLGGTSFGREVSELFEHDDGSGPALFAGGQFASHGSQKLNSIGKYDGQTWSALGAGMAMLPTVPLLAPITFPDVAALATYDEGAGPVLFAAGEFDLAGGVIVGNIARWDGSNWTRVGTGLPDTQRIDALLVFDSAAGPKLYAAGDELYVWDGVAWSTIATNEKVQTLAVYDVGNGPELYAAGRFSVIDGVTAIKIARFDGASWNPVLGGIGFPQSGSVKALEVFDDGNGPALYAGGLFPKAGAVSALNIARYDGVTWSEVGGGLDDLVDTLHVYDRGDGDRLYVGGRFDRADNVPGFEHVAAWDGQQWHALQQGADDNVWAIQDFQGDLYVGGAFSNLADTGDAYLAIYETPCVPPLAYCTAKASAIGCVATISTSDSGIQPVSGANDYDVIATGVDTLRPGLVFAGLNGPAALPFLGGTLCVQPPIDKRGPVVFSGGLVANICTGTLTTTVNSGAIVPSGLDGGPGVSVWYQWWYRDPANGAGSSGVALSDAIQLDFF